MEIYLVGGAVRDQLLGYPVTERDWVVVGATPQQMLDLGYKAVGKDFPVFLHPQTHEEYALARTERKTAPGYTGFQFYAAPDVTLEQDLQRRDLTINAIAQTHDGQLIDPYHGQQDLKDKILRHVSPAFAEDPVRVLRVARFAARFVNFTIHPDTLQLMQHMVQAGEVQALVAERVWQEWQRALQQPQPQRFFQVLADCGALPILFPEWSQPQTGLAALQRTAERGLPDMVRFAVLFYGLDKALIRELCQRYRVPRDYADLAILVATYLTDYQQAATFNAAELLQLLERLDAFRRPARLELFLLACEAITNTADTAASQQLRVAQLAAKAVKLDDLNLAEMGGEAVRDVLRQRQVEAIASATKTR